LSSVTAQHQARTSAERYKVGLMLMALHAAPIIALIMGTNRQDWILFACIYPIQAIGIGLGLHRYFAHRSFKTGRVFGFILALMSSCTFGDPVGFAGKHRLHHLHVDTDKDVHTPRHGIWACWIGSLLDNGYSYDEVMNRAQDWQQYPELMLLHRYAKVPALLLITLAFLIGGFSMAAIGICLGAVLLLHQTSAVNYFAHKRGSRRFDLPDQSTNNWVMGILAYGEGWHNNHHRYPRSARAGLYWWEIDVLYWLIVCLEKFGLVWDVHLPPTLERDGITRNKIQTSKQHEYSTTLES
jgi:stearoyl-CoA desaturase (delta-9 desaturase)